MAIRSMADDDSAGGSGPAVRPWDLPDDVLGVVLRLSGNRQCLRACSRAARAAIPAVRSPQADLVERLRLELPMHSATDLGRRLWEHRAECLGRHFSAGLHHPGGVEAMWASLRLCAAKLSGGDALPTVRGGDRARVARIADRLCTCGAAAYDSAACTCVGGRGRPASYDTAIDHICRAAACLSFQGRPMLRRETGGHEPSAQVWEALHQYLRLFHPGEAPAYARRVLDMFLLMRPPARASDETLVFVERLQRAGGRLDCSGAATSREREEAALAPGPLQNVELHCWRCWRCFSRTPHSAFVLKRHEAEAERDRAPREAKRERAEQRGECSDRCHD
jgi:hypothetical protein